MAFSSNGCYQLVDAVQAMPQKIIIWRDNVFFTADYWRLCGKKSNLNHRLQARKVPLCEYLPDFFTELAHTLTLTDIDRHSACRHVVHGGNLMLQVDFLAWRFGLLRTKNLEQLDRAMWQKRPTQQVD